MNNNPIIWCEIYVDDMKRAKTFYETVFEIRLQKIDSPNMEMWGFPMEMGKIGCGGALVKMEGAKPAGFGTIPYFHCEEVSIELGRVERAGGEIHKPKMDIGQYGFIALVTDTEGNMIGLHMPSKDMKK